MTEIEAVQERIIEDDLIWTLEESAMKHILDLGDELREQLRSDRKRLGIEGADYTLIAERVMQRYILKSGMWRMKAFRPSEAAA